MRSRHVVVPVLAAIAATAVSVLLDTVVWRQVARPGVYDHDWGRMLRVFGSLVFWIPLSVATWLVMGQAKSAGRERAWLLVVSPALAGVLAELVKLLVRRERPGLHEGTYVFRSFLERPFDTRDLGFPSSHAMLAFGGAAVASRLIPGSGPVVYLLAAGCGLSRVLAQAHFASDVGAGALLGWAVGVLLWRRFGSVSRGSG